MGEDSGGLLDGVICQAQHLPCVVRVLGGRWNFRNCVFRGQLVSGKVGHGGEEGEEGEEGDGAGVHDDCDMYKDVVNSPVRDLAIIL